MTKRKQLRKQYNVKETATFCFKLTKANDHYDIILINYLTEI